jgi:hypothetical protein
MLDVRNIREKALFMVVRELVFDVRKPPPPRVEIPGGVERRGHARADDEAKSKGAEVTEAYAEGTNWMWDIFMNDGMFQSLASSLLPNPVQKLPSIDMHVELF